MTDLLAALARSISNAALATHQKTCEVCSADYDCVIARAHKRSIERHTSPGDPQ